MRRVVVFIAISLALCRFAALGRASGAVATLGASSDAGGQGRAAFWQVSRFPGGDPAAQINECLRALPPWGGVCDARSVVAPGGVIEAYSNLFAGVSSPFELLLGSYTVRVLAPQTVGVRSSIRGAGPTTILYYPESSGTLLTLDYRDGAGLAAWVQAGLYDLYVDGPGRGTSSVGIELGSAGSGGGVAGIEVSGVAVRQFGTNVLLGSNAYSIHITDCYIENSDQGLSLPAGDSNSGEMVSLVGVIVADSGVGVSVAGPSFELECVDCSFDFNGTAVMLTAPSLVTTSNSHWESLGGAPFIVATAGEVSISGGLWAIDAGASPPQSYIDARGTASVSVVGSMVGAYGADLGSFVQWNSTGNLFLEGNVFLPASSVASVAAGFPGSGHGAVQGLQPDPSSLDGASLSLGGGPELTGVSGTGGDIVSDVAPTLDSPTIVGQLALPGSYSAGNAVIQQPRFGGRLALTSELPLSGITAPLGSSSSQANAKIKPVVPCAAGTHRRSPCRLAGASNGARRGKVCLSASAAVPGAEVGAVAVASPIGNPGTDVTWGAYVQTTATVVVVACGRRTSPRPVSYGVRVFCAGPCRAAFRAPPAQ